MKSLSLKRILIFSAGLVLLSLGGKPSSLVQANDLPATQQVIRIVSDSSWLVSNTPSSGWDTVNFDDSGWESTVAPAPANCGWVNCPDDPDAFTMWSKVQYQIIYLRKSFLIDDVSSVISATIRTTCDDFQDVYINGVLVASEWSQSGRIINTDIGTRLQTGKNVIAIKADDALGGCRWMCVGATITLGTPSPFLDLPLQYTNFSVEASGSNGGGGPGYVNSWFDHQYPNYSKNGFLWTWSQENPIPDPPDVNCTFGVNCYDGHDGIDFRNSQKDQPVYSAGAGTVFGVVNTCQVHDPTCGNYFGNQVWIDHGNGYATLYGHLAPGSVKVTNTTGWIPIGYELGIMGNTGNSIGDPGTHLHFGLYHMVADQWQPIDPYGWTSSQPDPWSVASSYFWIHPLSTQQQITNTGGAASTPSGNAIATIPSGALTDPVTLEMWDTPPVAGASAGLRSTGDSFLMRVLEWLEGGAKSQVGALTSSQNFNLPVTVTVKYDPSWIPHLDPSQLTVRQWDETGQEWVPLATIVDTGNNQVSTQTSQPGYFDLEGPLVCPADALEPNDNYDSSNIVQTNGSPVSSLFDIATDEDWFQFNGVAGMNYRIRTTNLSAGVDTLLEIYDTDGVTLLATDDNSGGGNASLLQWQAPTDGVYFVRIRQASGSSFGCGASYDFDVLGTNNIYLPFVSR